MTAYATILAATFQRQDEHQQPNTFGDLIRLDLECGHVRYGNPTMHFKVGSKYLCRTCEQAAATSQGTHT